MVLLLVFYATLVTIFLIAYAGYNSRKTNRDSENMDAFIRRTGNSLHSLHIKIDFMAKTQKELTQDVKGITEIVLKVSSESAQSLQRIKDLQDQIDAEGGVSPELQAAVDALKVQLQVVDDLVPDAPTTTEAPVTTEAPETTFEEGGL